MIDPPDSPGWGPPGEIPLPSATPPPPRPPPASPPRRGRRAAILALAMLLVAGAVVGVWLARRDDVGAPLDDTEWAARYCDTVTPYGDEASTQIRQLTLAATVPGGGAELKRLTTAFARLIDGVLAKIEQLSKDHPISDDGGADLTKQLQDALRDIRDKLATALSQVEKLDASAPDFATQAVAVLAASGISFDTRITMPQSAALNRLNVAITANAKCTSFFATG